MYKRLHKRFFRLFSLCSILIGFLYLLQKIKNSCPYRHPKDCLSTPADETTTEEKSNTPSSKRDYIPLSLSNEKKPEKMIS